MKPMDGERASEYAKRRRTLHLSSLAASTAAVGILAFSGFAARGGRAVDRSVKRPWLATLLGLLGTTAFSAVVSLPFRYASGFALEHRYGLSNLSRRRWWDEWAKSTAVATALTLAAGSGFYWLVRRSPRRWPVLATLASAPLIVTAEALAPLFILPLFNRYSPLAEGALRNDILQLARAHAIVPEEIFVLDMSRQTKKANAFVAGIGPSCRICLADTLLDAFERDEILFVLAHEIGHYRAGDSWKLAGMSGASWAFFFFALAAIWRAACQTDGEGLRRLDEPGAVPLAAFVADCLSLVALPAMNAFSREIERAADRYAASSEPGLVEAGVRAFEKLAATNLSEMDPEPWVEMLLCSHPSLRRRIEFLRSRLPA